MRRRRAPGLVVSLLALLVGCAREAPPAVVLVVIDTLRWDRLSLGGYDRPTSPNLDAFADDATVFTRAFAPPPGRGRRWRRS